MWVSGPPAPLPRQFERQRTVATIGETGFETAILPNRGRSTGYPGRDSVLSQRKPNPGKPPADFFQTKSSPGGKNRTVAAPVRLIRAPSAVFLLRGLSSAHVACTVRAKIGFHVSPSKQVYGGAARNLSIPSRIGLHPFFGWQRFQNGRFDIFMIIAGLGAAEFPVMVVKNMDLVQRLHCESGIF